MSVRWLAAVLCGSAAVCTAHTQTPSAGAAPVPVKLYVGLCAGCHGEGATGTERGPALLNNRRLRSRNEDQIRNLIRNGTQTGMPPFALPDNQLRSLAKWVHAMNASAWEVKPEGDAVAGAEFFFGNGQCATCYMVSGRGTPNGPDLSDLGRHLTVHDLEESLDNLPSRAGKRSSTSCPG